MLRPMTFDQKRFPGQLGHWSWHCAINAAPSFLIAAVVLELWKSPVAVGGILAAIATFVLGYAVLTSFSGPLSDPQSLPARALRVGKRIRLGISLLSLLVLLPALSQVPDESVMFLPDFWCGVVAAIAVNWVGEFFGFGSNWMSDADRVGFLAVYLTTLIEGLILSFMLLMLSFFSLVVLQIRRRRRGGERAGEGVGSAE